LLLAARKYESRKKTNEVPPTVERRERPSQQTLFSREGDQKGAEQRGELNRLKDPNATEVRGRRGGTKEV